MHQIIVIYVTGSGETGHLVQKMKLYFFNLFKKHIELPLNAVLLAVTRIPKKKL